MDFYGVAIQAVVLVLVPLYEILTHLNGAWVRSVGTHAI